jgi:CheY-like chemotaxis protein
MQTGKSCGKAVDGQDATAKTRHLAPDVIVMDYVMPTMDGIEATHSHSRDEEDNSAKHAVL